MNNLQSDIAIKNFKELVQNYYQHDGLSSTLKKAMIDAYNSINQENAVELYNKFASLIGQEFNENRRNFNYAQLYYSSIVIAVGCVISGTGWVLNSYIKRDNISKFGERMMTFGGGVAVLGLCVFFATGH